MELAPGLEITGSLRLVKKLGEGGMGSVWVADHLALHTKVAVKFMTEHLALDPLAAARFTREATAAAQIKSPHVVQIFDHGLLEGHIPFIVMELLEGEELSRFIVRNGPVACEITGQIIVQLCKALAKAHAHDVIHRDIKPENVFLVESDGDIFVKLLDFGIAKQTRENIHVTSTGAVVGTPHYMSPEQLLSSKHVDFRSDLWAVGVVAYQCLTGKLPFDGETFAAIAVAITHGEIPLPYKTLGIGSPQLDVWFAHALSRDKELRFGSAREMAEDFIIAANAGPLRRARGSFSGPLDRTEIMGSWDERSGAVQRVEPTPPPARVIPPTRTDAGREGPAATAPQPMTFNGVAATHVDHGGQSRRKIVTIGVVGALVIVAVLGIGVAIAVNKAGAIDDAATLPVASGIGAAAEAPAPASVEPKPAAPERKEVEPAAEHGAPSASAPSSHPPIARPAHRAPLAKPEPGIKPEPSIKPEPEAKAAPPPPSPEPHPSVPKPTPTIRDRGF